MLTKTVNIEHDGCDVCSNLTVTLKDSGNLKDKKTFGRVVRCNDNGDKNNCCGLDGCWKVGEQGGCGYSHCFWEPIETCDYTICAGGCAGDELTLTAITKERRYADMCTDCGNCVCSNSLNPQYRSSSCPASVSCPSCEEDSSDTGSGIKD